MVLGSGFLVGLPPGACGQRGVMEATDFGGLNILDFLFCLQIRYLRNFLLASLSGMVLC